MLLGVPIPAENALHGETTRKAVGHPLAELDKHGIAGEDATPAPAAGRIRIPKEPQRHTTVARPCC